jgi:hypothetical protein
LEHENDLFRSSQVGRHTNNARHLTDAASALMLQTSSYGGGYTSVTQQLDHSQAGPERGTPAHTPMSELHLSHLGGMGAASERGSDRGDLFPGGGSGGDADEYAEAYANGHGYGQGHGHEHGYSEERERAFAPATYADRSAPLTMVNCTLTSLYHATLYPVTKGCHLMPAPPPLCLRPFAPPLLLLLPPPTGPGLCLCLCRRAGAAPAGGLSDRRGALADRAPAAVRGSGARGHPANGSELNGILQCEREYERAAAARAGRRARHGPPRAIRIRIRVRIRARTAAGAGAP